MLLFDGEVYDGEVYDGLEPLEIGRNLQKALHKFQFRKKIHIFLI